MTSKTATALAALAAALFLPAATLAAPGACKADVGGGCERDGLPCSPASDDAAKNGKCYSVKQERILKCLCLATAPKGRGVSLAPAPTRPLPSPGPVGHEPPSPH